MEEIFDIVDHHDRVIGQAGRTEVHGNPSLMHRVVHVLVINSDNGIFLQKRAANKDVQPGKWDTSVGGHVLSGEDWKTAAVREVEEELGIVLDIPVTYLYSYTHSNDFESEYVKTYIIDLEGPFRVQEDEISEGRFWSFSEIDAALETGIFTPNFVDEITRFRKFYDEFPDNAYPES